MYISVNKALLKQGLLYLAAALLTALFGAVYEHFSHEVYSYFMLYAFLIPLGLGALPLFLLALLGRKFSVGWGFRLYGYGIAAWTVGSLFRGVLEIYGTTSHLCAIYGYAGAALVLTGILIVCLQLRTGRRQESDGA